MNCDDAFDQLTTLGAQDDAALQRHLAGCPRCRDMQETLSPALDGFAAAAESDFAAIETRPSYLTEDAVQLAERTARRLSRESANTRCSPWPRVRLTAFTAAACVAAICLFAVFWPAARRNLTDRSFGPAPRSPHAICNRTTLGDSSLPRTAEQVIATCIACHLPTGQ